MKAFWFISTDKSVTLIIAKDREAASDQFRAIYPDRVEVMNVAAIRCDKCSCYIRPTLAAWPELKFHQVGMLESHYPGEEPKDLTIEMGKNIM